MAGRPVGHFGEIEAEIRHRAHHGNHPHRHGLRLQIAMLENRSVPLECLLQLGRLVGAAQPRPGRQVRTRRHRGRGVRLQECQPVNDRQQVMGPSGIEQLRPDGNPASLVASESADLSQALGLVSG
jgi:hypothetical protein